MKLSRFKLLLIAPSLILTSCGYGLKEVYEGRPYDSSIFKENYFNVWDKRINPYKEGNKITVTKENYILDEEQDKVFLSLKDATFKDCDDNWGNYAYGYDKTAPEGDDEGKLAYGPAVKMTSLDDSFKYGVVSKMFDGQMFCNGDFQKSRTQVESINNDDPSKGFGVLFSKETNNASYFMMNFKCSVVKEDDQNLGRCDSMLELKISFFLKNDTGYTRVPVSYVVDNVPTNSGDGFAADRFNNYVCFGFKLDNIETDRLIGFSLQYEKISDSYSETHSGESVLHAMMLYEVSFPYTTWH